MHANLNERAAGTGTTASGPLRGLRVVEFAGIGPGPFAAMLLSDMGADVVRIDRPGSPAPDASNFVARGRTLLRMDLKDTGDLRATMELLAHADVLIEGFRPGVMERLGLGPDVVRETNTALVYARMTGWGQTGPLAEAAAHDINYIAITGALAAIGPRGGPPVPPLNLVGDYGGGSLYLVAGILAALVERARSGLGQVVDAAICDGALSLMTPTAMHRARGNWRDERGTNLLDGGRPYYATYETADGKHISVGAIEPHFFELLCDRIGLAREMRALRDDASRKDQTAQAMAGIFRRRTRAEWCELLEGTDACFAPVLTLDEARLHPHLVARRAFVETEGTVKPAATPRFSRTPSAMQTGREESGHGEVLARWRASGAV